MTTEERFAALEKAVNTAVMAAAPQNRDATFDELAIYDKTGELVRRIP